MNREPLSGLFLVNYIFYPVELHTLNYVHLVSNCQLFQRSTVKTCNRQEKAPLAALHCIILQLKTFITLKHSALHDNQGPTAAIHFLLQLSHEIL